MNVDVALLLIRAVVGLTLATHGAQKLFGWFGGGGLSGTGRFFESLGFHRRHAWVAAITEFFGGLALAVGFLTPLAAAAVFGTMLTVIATASWRKGFFNTNGGFEFPLLIGVVALATAFSGAGEWSVDHALGWTLGGTDWGVAMVALAVLASFVVTTTRGVRFGRARRSVPA